MHASPGKVAWYREASRWSWDVLDFKLGFKVPESGGGCLCSHTQQAGSRELHSEILS